MCVNDGTNICERPDRNKPCGWCILAKCPQAKTGLKKSGAN